MTTPLALPSINWTTDRGSPKTEELEPESVPEFELGVLLWLELGELPWFELGPLPWFELGPLLWFELGVLLP